MSKLDDFKVEELEQRLEMRKWSDHVSVGLDPCKHANIQDFTGNYVGCE